MRFFRIPSFTGIETHRDDADRGSLRVVEGCLPFGSGGLRSGPVWQDAGTVSMVSQADENQLTASDDGNGNSALFVSRLEEVHDMALFTSEHTKVSFFVSTYSVVDPLDLYRKQRAVVSPVGNRLFSFGDSDGEAVFIGKGPPTAQASVFPDETLYSYEWSRFPNCKFFVQGPKKTLFASGNPDKPLTVYISEPASKTSPYRDSPYSTSNTNQIPGSMSTVDILGSNASVITALSTRGDQVVVHTDKGCHILYAPSADQAETGYRVEQAPATNFSAAVNAQVVGGESGTMSYWLGHDGQIYKDESATRGAEDKKSQADPDQASWKAKGIWEKELHHNLKQSFATYDPQSGMYWLYVLSSEHLDDIKDSPPHTVIGVEATPELPGSIDSLVALPEKPGKPLELAGLPELPGTVTDLELITPPGQVKELEALPEEPGTVTLSALPEKPGTVSDLAGLPERPGTVENLGLLTKPGNILVFDAKPELPGKVSALSSAPEKPGTVQSVSAEPERPGKILTFTSKPERPGQVQSLNTSIDLPGTIPFFTANPELPGRVLSLSSLPELPGAIQNLTATAATVRPGTVTNLTALPEFPGVVSGLTASVDSGYIDPNDYAFDGAFFGTGQMRIWDGNLPVREMQGSCVFHSNNYPDSAPPTNLTEMLATGNTSSNRMNRYYPDGRVNGAAKTVDYCKVSTSSSSSDKFKIAPIAVTYEGLRDFNDLVYEYLGTFPQRVWKLSPQGTMPSWKIEGFDNQGNDDEVWLVYDPSLEQYTVLEFPMIGEFGGRDYYPTMYKHLKKSSYDQSLDRNNPFGVYSLHWQSSNSNHTCYVFAPDFLDSCDPVHPPNGQPAPPVHITLPENSTLNGTAVTSLQVHPASGTADSEQCEGGGGSGPPECSGNNTHYWRWNGSSLVDLDNNAFDLTDTLFYTYVSGFKHAQTPWNGVHQSGGPFPNTQALAQSYQGTGAADTNIFWGSLPSQKPYNGGKSIHWDHSSTGSNGGPIYQMWHAFAPATVNGDGMREWEADFTAQASPGYWTMNRTMKLFRNSATGNMGINMMRGTVIDMSFVKVDNTDSCELTGVYHEINGANFMIYVGLRPQNLGPNRMGAYHQDGSLFELHV